MLIFFLKTVFSSKAPLKFKHFSFVEIISTGNLNINQSCATVHKDTCPVEKDVISNLTTSNLCYFIAMLRPWEKDLTSLKEKVEHKRAQAKQSVGMYV